MNPDTPSPDRPDASGADEESFELPGTERESHYGSAKKPRYTTFEEAGEGAREVPASHTEAAAAEPKPEAKEAPAPAAPEVVAAAAGGRSESAPAADAFDLHEFVVKSEAKTREAVSEKLGPSPRERLSRVLARMGNLHRIAKGGAILAVGSLTLYAAAQGARNLDFSSEPASVQAPAAALNPAGDYLDAIGQRLEEMRKAAPGATERAALDQLEREFYVVSYDMAQGDRGLQLEIARQAVSREIELLQSSANGEARDRQVKRLNDWLKDFESDRWKGVNNDMSVAGLQFMIHTNLGRIANAKGDSEAYMMHREAAGVQLERMERKRDVVDAPEMGSETPRLFEAAAMMAGTPKDTMGVAARQAVLSGTRAIQEITSQRLQGPRLGGNGPTTRM